VSNSACGAGAGKVAVCCASPTVPLAESVPETDSSTIRSPASEVAGATAYRYRAILAAPPIFCACRWGNKMGGLGVGVSAWMAARCS
jgi:hypothetical protein